jgi:ubiquinone/menaquinone biosynthesis C-methylase UbiE
LSKSVEQKVKEIHAWERVLSKCENYAKELEKPASLGVLWTIVHLNNARVVLGLIGNVEGKRVLDICCGGGWFAKLVAEKGGKYVGVELSPSFCRIALARTRREGIEGDVVRGDAENLPFRDRVFDSAFTYEALHHIPEPYDGIREALRVSNSFTLGDEPANLPKPIEFLTVNVLKESIFKEGEPSGDRPHRFGLKDLKAGVKKEGYIVAFKRQWTYVPKIFSKHENNLVVTKAYLLIYCLLMKFFKPFSNSITVHIKARSK